MNLSKAALSRLSRGLGSGAPPVGFTIDERYRVVRRIAGGGMGEVFEAEDLKLSRPVAMKVLTKVLLTEQGAARFQAEARATTLVDHPGVVPIHDLGRLPDGRLYYTMKLVEGRTLGELVEAGTELGRLVSILVSISDVVSHAHARGVVHRDLKPSNIMIEVPAASSPAAQGAGTAAGTGTKPGAGRVFILDWGVARMRSEATQQAQGDLPGAARGMTAAGTVLGTAGYMSPEQARGEAADARSDVYSLGVILRDVLNGHTSSELDAVSTRCLASNPDQRYPTAAEVGAELSRWLLGEPVLAYRRPWPVRLGKWARKRPAVIVAALSLLGAAGFIAWKIGRAETDLVRHQKVLAGRVQGNLMAALDKIEAARERSYDPVAGRTSPEAELAEAERLVARSLSEDYESSWTMGGWLRGRIALMQGDLDGAASSFRNSFSVRGFTSELDLGRALAIRISLNAVGRPPAPDSGLAREARHTLEAAIGKEPVYAPLDREIVRALLAYVSGDAEGVLATCRKGVSRFGRSHGVEELEWLAAAASTDDGQRMEHLDAALSIRPGFALAALARGITRLRLYKNAEGMKDLDLAVFLAPRCPWAFAERSSARLLREDLAGAAEDAERALSIDSRFVSALLLRARVRTARGEIDRALEDYSTAAGVAPEDAWVRMDRAKIFMSRGELVRAKEDLEVVIKIATVGSAERAEADTLHRRLEH